MSKNHFITFEDTTNYSHALDQMDSLIIYFSLIDSADYTPAIIYWDDPFYASLDTLRSNGGVIINKIDLNLVTGFKKIALDSGLVLTGSLHSHPAIAPYKLFPRIAEWIHTNHCERDRKRIIIQINKENGAIEVRYPIRFELLQPNTQN